MLCTIGKLNIGNIFNFGTCVIIKAVIPLLFSVAIVVFVWGAIRYFIVNVDEEAKRSQGKQFMIWGIVGLAVMISVWGLVRILGTTVGLNTRIIPGVRPSNSSFDTGGGDTGDEGQIGDPNIPSGPTYEPCRLEEMGDIGC